MTWQTYCNNFEVLLKDNKELTAIRQELFFRIGANKLKAFVRFVLYFLMLLKYLFKINKKIDTTNVDNLYFIDSPTSANLGTLKPLILKDTSKKILLLNNQVEKSDSFQVLTKFSNLNFQDFYKVRLKDIVYLLKTSRLVARQMNTSFFIVFPMLCRYILNKNSLEYILSSVKTKNIITSNDTLLTSNTAIHISQKYKINDYTLQHGFLTHFYVPTTATNYIVWGEKAKVWFEKEKVSSKILPLGTPRLDEIENIKQNSETIKDNFYKKYNVDTTKKIFFYMSHSQAPEFGIELHRQNFKALKEVVKNESYQLVIKLHPSENDKLFKEVFEKELESIILLPKDENLYHAIVSSTICASAYSTTLVEAMCFEKPTLQMNLAKVKELPDYSKQEGCIRIESIDELIVALEKTDFDSLLNRQNLYVEKYFTNLGMASIKILDFIGENNAN